MRDNKNIKKLLYLCKNNIALIVLGNVNDQRNILFSKQMPIDNADLKVKILELLTKAANFLGFNIKDVEIIFDDPVITNYSLTNQEFVDCNCKEDICKEIYKKAKIDNYFVNEVNFYGVIYDEIDKVARANCQICASDYIVYKKYLRAVKSCNVIVNSSTNLCNLLKITNNEIELTLRIKNNQIYAYEYYGKKLNNVKIIDLNFDDIKQHLSDKFNISQDKINDVLLAASKLSNVDDVNIVNNYDMKTKSFNNVKLTDFLDLYRDEVRTQISNYVDFRNFQSIQVISSNEINAISGFGFVTNNNVCLNEISIDKIVSLNNVDINNKDITQFSFENKTKQVNLLA